MATRPVGSTAHIVGAAGNALRSRPTHSVLGPRLRGDDGGFKDSGQGAAELRPYERVPCYLSSMSSALPVLKFRPVIMPKPWGGDGLWRFLKKGAPGDDGMGESWELSDRPEGETPVMGGPLDGARLADLLARDPVSLLGPDLASRKAGAHFPLLYKFIPAREKL